MTFDPQKYYEMINGKYANFAQVINAGFNTLNNTKPIEGVDERVATLHSLILNQQEFDKTLFTEEEYQKEKVISDEEFKRISGLISGELKPYLPSEEDLSLLLVEKEDLKNCIISEQDYVDSLKALSQENV